jgi:hypothetical protein
MDFTKNELSTLKYLQFYKIFSIIAIIISTLNLLYGLYFYLYRIKSPDEAHWNNALMGASIVVLGMGLMQYSFIKIIMKFKRIYFDNQ